MEEKSKTKYFVYTSDNKKTLLKVEEKGMLVKYILMGSMFEVDTMLAEDFYDWVRMTKSVEVPIEEAVLIPGFCS